MIIDLGHCACCKYGYYPYYDAYGMYGNGGLTKYMRCCPHRILPTRLWLTVDETALEKLPDTTTNGLSLIDGPSYPLDYDSVGEFWYGEFQLNGLYPHCEPTLVYTERANPYCTIQVRVYENPEIEGCFIVQFRQVNGTVYYTYNDVPGCGFSGPETPPPNYWDFVLYDFDCNLAVSDWYTLPIASFTCDPLTISTSQGIVIQRGNFASAQGTSGIPTKCFVTAAQYAANNFTPDPPPAVSTELSQSSTVTITE